MPANTPDQPDRDANPGAERRRDAGAGERIRPARGDTDGRVRPAPRDTEAGGSRRSPPPEPGARREPGDAEPRPARRPVPRQRPGPARPASRAPLAVAAAFASGWAALTSYLPVAMVLGAAQFMEDSGSVSGAARSGLAGWLLGHGVPLRTADGPLGLAPLALGMLAAWRLVRAGVHVSRAVGARGARSPRRALAVAVAVGAGYGIIGGIAALVVGTTAVSVWRAALTLAVFGAAAGSLGALRAFRALDVLARRTPAVLRSGVRTGVVAALLLLAAGAGVTGLAVATGGGEASEMIGAYRTGVAGQTGITLVSLGYAPNAAVWAAAYLLGPGFAVGTGTVVRASEVSLGALPALPVLAGLPDGPLSGVAAALLGVPVLAGMVAGWLLARRVRRSAGRVSTGWVPLLATAAVSGPVAGALLGVAAMLSGGPLGDGRLAVIGPDSLRVCLTATLVVGAGAVVGAAATRGLAGPDHH